MFISFCCDPASFLVQGLQMGEFSYNSPRLNAHLCEAFIKIFMKNSSGWSQQRMSQFKISYVLYVMSYLFSTNSDQCFKSMTQNTLHNLVWFVGWKHAYLFYLYFDFQSQGELRLHIEYKHSTFNRISYCPDMNKSCYTFAWF